MYTVEGRTSERKRTAGRGEEGGTKVGEDAYRRQSPLAAIQEEARRSRARRIDRVSGGAALCAKGYAEIEFQVNTEAEPSETFPAQNLGGAGGLEFVSVSAQQFNGHPNGRITGPISNSEFLGPIHYIQTLRKHYLFPSGFSCSFI